MMGRSQAGEFDTDATMYILGDELVNFSEFEKQWAKVFRVSDDYDNVKYEYLKEKYK
jgi:hypothetical protein